MKKIHKNLTYDQVRRGVIFSSTLSKYMVEQEGDTTHEIFRDGRNNNKRHLLLDDSFFNNSPFKYNIIREGEPKNPEILETKPAENLECYDAARNKTQLKSIYWAAKQSYNIVKVYKTTIEANAKEFPFTIYVDHSSIKR